MQLPNQIELVRHDYVNIILCNSMFYFLFNFSHENFLAIIK